MFLLAGLNLQHSRKWRVGTTSCSDLTESSDLESREENLAAPDRLDVGNSSKRELPEVLTATPAGHCTETILFSGFFTVKWTRHSCSIWLLGYMSRLIFKCSFCNMNRQLWHSFYYNSGICVMFYFSHVVSLNGTGCEFVFIFPLLRGRSISYLVFLHPKILFSTKSVQKLLCLLI